MKAILLIAHGSKSEQATKEVIGLANLLQKNYKDRWVQYCFLDVASPDIEDGIERCFNEGALEITVLLHFLNSGNHVLKDIPELIHKAELKYPQIQFHLTKPIGLHDRIPELYFELLG